MLNRTGVQLKPSDSISFGSVAYYRDPSQSDSNDVDTLWSCNIGVATPRRCAQLLVRIPYIRTRTVHCMYDPWQGLSVFCRRRWISNCKHCKLNHSVQSIMQVTIAQGSRFNVQCSTSKTPMYTCVHIKNTACSIFLPEISQCRCAVQRDDSHHRLGSAFVNLSRRVCQLQLSARTIRKNSEPPNH